jgi:hypothetical protein
MSPGKLPVKKITRGGQLFESYQFSYTLPVVVDGEDETPQLPTPFPLSQFDRFKMHVRRSNNAFGPLIYELATGDGITITGENNDTLNLIHSSQKTKLFEADGEHYRDIFGYIGSEGFPLVDGRLIVTYNKTEDDE